MGALPDQNHQQQNVRPDQHDQSIGLHLPRLSAADRSRSLARDLDKSVKDAAPKRATDLLERVGLQDRMSHRPGQLSGGECQRVSLARALINQPKLILADEPTGSLDEETADELTAMLTDLTKEHSVTLITVTHSMRLAKRMQGGVMLRRGRIEPWTPNE